MNRKFWIIFLALVVGVLGFAIYQSKSSSTTSRKVENPRIVQADDNIRGNAEAKVFLIEYGDFECPSCTAWEPYLQELTQEYGDRVAFIFRHFPLVDKHVNAKAAARASEAAALQGKFWEMHDLLFERSSDWVGDRKSAQSKFEGYAQELGLDLEKFKTDFASSEVADRIDSDLLSAGEIGAQGTPTFFLNGEKVEPGSGNADGKARLKQLLEAKLAEVQ